MKFAKVVVGMVILAGLVFSQEGQEKKGPQGKVKVTFELKANLESKDSKGTREFNLSKEAEFTLTEIIQIMVLTNLQGLQLPETEDEIEDVGEFFIKRLFKDVKVEDATMNFHSNATSMGQGYVNTYGQSKGLFDLVIPVNNTEVSVKADLNGVFLVNQVISGENKTTSILFAMQDRTAEITVVEKESHKKTTGEGVLKIKAVEIIEITEEEE